VAEGPAAAREQHEALSPCPTPPAFGSLSRLLQFNLELKLLTRMRREKRGSWKIRVLVTK